MAYRITLGTCVPECGGGGGCSCSRPLEALAEACSSSRCSSGCPGSYTRDTVCCSSGGSSSTRHTAAGVATCCTCVRLLCQRLLLSRRHRASSSPAAHWPLPGSAAAPPPPPDTAASAAAAAQADLVSEPGAGSVGAPSEQATAGGGSTRGSSPGAGPGDPACDSMAAGGSRSSVSSDNSETHGTVSMSKRWTTLETVGRCMFLLSVAFFIIGVLITVFGFSNTGIAPANRVPLQIIGPACLTMTLVMWGAGCLFSRLWNMEWKRQQQAIELRDRVQLHALAMDILNRPVLSPAMLQDPRIRRQLMMKLRQQKTLDISSEAPSRRSSRAVSVDSRIDHRRRQSSACSALLQQEIERRKSLGKDAAGEDIKGLPFELPGIQISRIETLDLGEGSIAGTASGSGRGSKRYIIIHSDVSSDFSRLSCPSDYSLAGSTSRSRSRSSRASSGVSSRLWDFSPRESEWDADVSLGSRESQLNVSKQDWGGGPSEYGDYTISPTTPRKMSVVTFDMSSPLRRHSSPASAGRRKDSGCECTCGKNSTCSTATATEYPSVLKNRDMSCHAFRYADEMPLPTSSLRKKSADQSILSVRIDEDERELDVDESTPLRSAEVASGGSDKIGSKNHICNEGATAAVESEHSLYCMERRDSRVLRPPLKRNNTDDSEVERRVAKLFKEIEFSVSDSVDESKINSQEYDSMVRRVEAQTQTLNDAEIERMTESLNIIELVEVPRRGSKTSTKSGTGSGRGNRHDSIDSFNDNMRVSMDSGDLHLVAGEEGHTKTKEKKSKLQAISSALSHLGKRSSSTDSGGKEKRLAKAKNIPRRLLIHLGLSEDSVKSSDIEAGQVKSPPPTYEDVVNENL